MSFYRSLWNLLDSGIQGRVLHACSRGLKKIFGVGRFYRIFGRMLNRVRFSTPNISNIKESQYWAYGEALKPRSWKISVVVPCYNHAEYLRQRLDTIYQQTYPAMEIILLDDMSSDNSREILLEYAKRYPEVTRVAFNEERGGSPFRQWKKGMELAKGELIWIAESDDWCELNFLEELVKNFQNEAVMLAFSNIIGRNGDQVYYTDQTLMSGFISKVKEEYVMSAPAFLRAGFAYMNLIINVSGVLFKKPTELNSDALQYCEQMKCTSDWIFYLALIQGGCVAHTSKTKAYYRLHESSVCSEIQKTERFYEEDIKAACYIAEHYKTTGEYQDQIANVIRGKYVSRNNTFSNDIVKRFGIEKIRKIQGVRKPNIVMCCFSLQPGGGETYPIYLANEMHQLGYSVTFLDMNLENHDNAIRNLLYPEVPLVCLKNMDELLPILLSLECDIIHTHHGATDANVGGRLKRAGLECKHIITLHGMYESSDGTDWYINSSYDNCSKYIYIADKNLVPFRDRNLYSEDKFVKISNGLPVPDVCKAYSRSALGIPEDAFVYCLASRGLREKGWKEAIEAVEYANHLLQINNIKSMKGIHLVILGDGPIRAELEESAPSFIHFMGVRGDVSSFFTMANAGILPTYYKGESYPLTVIECLQSNRPMVVTEIAETRNQLDDGNGNLAGILIPQDEAAGINVNKLQEAVLMLATDKVMYEEKRRYCRAASEKFDIHTVTEKYLDVYREVLGRDF